MKPKTVLGTFTSGTDCRGNSIEHLEIDMANDSREGNEPTPLILVAVAIGPVLAVAAWFMFR